MSNSITGIRGMVAQGDCLFAVSGNEMYRYNRTTPDTPVSQLKIGELATTTGIVSMAINGTQVCTVDGDSGYIATNTTDLVAITDPDFPNGVDTVIETDSVFVASQEGESQFYQSDISNGLSWNGLAVATKEGAPDPIQAIVASQRELILLGYETSEIWINNGDSTILFQRSGNAFIESGCAAKRSVANLDYTIYWLGADKRGQGMVWCLEGSRARRVSTHAIEYWLGQASRLDDAFAIAYQQEGHSFYALTVPDLDQTFVYDVASDMWHERSWRNQTAGTDHHWRASCHVMFDGYHLVGDWENGNICRLDLDVYLDNARLDENSNYQGEMIRRVRTTPTMNDDDCRLFFHQLEINMQSGVGKFLSSLPNQAEDPKIMLRYSNDGGNTWSDILYASIGKAGEYFKRVLFSRLGSGRNRVWEISITDPVMAVILGANAKVTKGRF